MRPRDTSPEAWKVLMDLIRKMTPEERLQRTFEACAFIEVFVRAGMRERHPEAGERELFLRLARLRLGAELYSKVYGAELAL
jgi:hypothetical protein